MGDCFCKDTKTTSDDILLSLFEPSPYENDIWKHQQVLLPFIIWIISSQRGINAAPIKGATILEPNFCVLHKNKQKHN